MIEKFEKSLKQGLTKPLEVFCYETIDSTNNFAKEIAKNGTREAVVAALHQTSGRGRLQRSFFSCGGVYLSIVLRPSKRAKTAVLMTVAAAVAVCHAIEKISDKKCEIKWVNDIYIDGKKVCGILSEGALNSVADALEYAVVGIGVNLTVPPQNFPEEIKNTASAVFENTELSEEQKGEFTALVVNEFFRIFEGKEDFVKEYRDRSYLNGKTVCFTKENGEHTAIVIGIDNNAGLIIEENGERSVLNAGEVSVKKI